MFKHSLILLFVLSCFTSFSQRGIKVENREDSIGISYGLVVGISSYPNIKRLLYADDDAYLFADYLVNSHICRKENVVRLIDSVATQANFYKELKKILNKVNSNDRVFIYFAGHGDVETDIESGFLLTYNSESNNYPATDAIDISMLERYVNALVTKKAKVVLITDACRAGNLAGGLTGATNTMTTLSKSFHNVIKLLSCQPNQLSGEKYYSGGGHGIFTYHLIDGLSGLADKTGKQYITLKDLDRYLDIVGDETKQQQNPLLEGDPNAVIANYNDTIKMAVLNRKGNREDLAVNINRGLNDSAWEKNPYYIKFNEQVRKRQLIEPLINPSPGNAYNTIQAAITNKEPANLVQDMKLDLGAVLEDEAQKWINKYLRAEENLSTVLVTDLMTIKKYMQVLNGMIGEKDLRYTDILVKKIFFEACYIFYEKNETEYPYAITQLEKANQLLPNQAWIKNLLGNLYTASKKYSQAETIFKAAVDLAPNWAYPWISRGKLYECRQQPAEAEIMYKKAIATDSTCVYPWINLGILYSSQQKYPEAEMMYKKAMGSSYTTVFPWYNLGFICYFQQKYPQAEMLYKKAAAIDSTISILWVELGLVYAEQHKTKEAEAAIKKALELGLTDGGILPAPGGAAYYDIACSYSLLNMNDKALEFLEGSFNNGFIDFAHIDADSDLDNIRNSPQFIVLINKYKKEKPQKNKTN